MSTDTDAPEYTPGQLLGMDEKTARTTLTVAQFERWEKVNDLHAEAAETKQEWAAEDEQVTDLTVHADPEQLGTEVDLFGNDVLVHVDSESEEFRAVAEEVDAQFGDRDIDAVENFDAADRDAIAEGFQEMLDIVLVRWNGHEWAELRPAEREYIREQWREKWGVDGLLKGWIDIAVAVNEAREEQLDVIESFRSPERRGDRRGAAPDRA